MLSQYLMIGEITKPQGVRGEVKVRPPDFATFKDTKAVTKKKIVRKYKETPCFFIFM